jgi:tetratricopeptide (TPR) repeat protein
MMINPEFVERYQLEYEKNPKSRVFAPLAEAYRQMGFIEEAKRICEKGIEYHPDFASGHLTYGRILLETKAVDQALTQLEKAAELSPDNLLAQSLMGETLLKLRRPKDALKAFKMVLFLNPDDERAQKIVRKWEFLSADEYESELFEMKPVFDDRQGSAQATSIAERAISMADAFTVRGDIEEAVAVLEDAQRRLTAKGVKNPEIDNRFRLLSLRAQKEQEPLEIQDENSESIEPAQDKKGDKSSYRHKRRKLEVFLRRINERRLS